MILFPLAKNTLKISTGWTFSDKTWPVWESGHSTPYETAYGCRAIIGIVFELVLLLVFLQIRDDGFTFIMRCDFHGERINFSLLGTISWKKVIFRLKLESIVYN